MKTALKLILQKLTKIKCVLVGADRSFHTVKAHPLNLFPEYIYLSASQAGVVNTGMCALKVTFCHNLNNMNFANFKNGFVIFSPLNIQNLRKITEQCLFLQFLQIVNVFING